MKNEQLSFSGSFAKQGLTALAVATTVFATPAAILAVSQGTPDSSVARMTGSAHTAESGAMAGAGRELVLAGSNSGGDDVGWD